MVEEWQYLVVNQNEGEPPADVLIINDTYRKHDVIITYERYNTFCYNDLMRDYVRKFIPSHKFLIVYNYLKRKYNGRRTH